MHLRLYKLFNISQVLEHPSKDDALVPPCPRLAVAPLRVSCESL